MKRAHSIAISAAAAVLAAAIVLALNASRQAKHAVKNVAAPATSHAVAQGMTTAHTTAKAGSKPPAGLTAPPPLPESIRNGGKPPKLPDNLPKPEEMREQFAMLRSFLELPPERLTRIRESIERIEQMPPERKKLMLERIRDVNPLSTHLKPDANTVITLQDAPEKIRARVSELLEAMTPEEKNLLLDTLKGYSPEQRAVYFEGMAAGATATEAHGKNEENVPWTVPHAWQTQPDAQAGK